MRWSPKVQITPEVISQVRTLVYSTAEKRGVPAAYITAHVTTKPACQARLEVWSVMICDMHLRRFQVAAMFGRDIRRVRRSVLGF